MSPHLSASLLSTQSDARLLGLAQTGHERAFEALVRRYRRTLLAHCRRLLLSPERAEDALQQGLLQAWLALREGAEVSHVKPWLYRIVHNTALNALRVSGYDYCKLSETLSGASAPQDDLDRRIEVREALAGLAALPEMQRQALLRTAVEGATHEQAAHDMGVSETAVRGLVYRARASLRGAVGALIPTPLLNWALEAGGPAASTVERAGEIGFGVPTAGLVGLLVKGSAAAVTAGALAGAVHFSEHSPTITVERSTPAPTSHAETRGANLPGRSRAISSPISPKPSSAGPAYRPHGAHEHIHRNPSATKIDRGEMRPTPGPQLDAYRSQPYGQERGQGPPPFSHGTDTRGRGGHRGSGGRDDGGPYFAQGGSSHDHERGQGDGSGRGNSNGWPDRKHNDRNRNESAGEHATDAGTDASSSAGRKGGPPGAPSKAGSGRNRGSRNRAPTG